MRWPTWSAWGTSRSGSTGALKCIFRMHFFHGKVLSNLSETIIFSNISWNFLYFRIYFEFKKKIKIQFRFIDRGFSIHLEYRIIVYQEYGKDHTRLIADPQPSAISTLEIYRLKLFRYISSVILLFIVRNKQMNDFCCQSVNLVNSNTRFWLDDTNWNGLSLEERSTTLNPNS